jgi:hypothetical protein
VSGRCNSGARFLGAARGVIGTNAATNNLSSSGALAYAPIDERFFTRSCGLRMRGAGGGRVAVGCDNFSGGGNPLRSFVTRTVTTIVNRNLVRGLRLGDCARISRR